VLFDYTFLPLINMQLNFSNHDWLQLPSECVRSAFLHITGKQMFQNEAEWNSLSFENTTMRSHKIAKATMSLLQTYSQFKHTFAYEDIQQYRSPCRSACLMDYSGSCMQLSGLKQTTNRNLSLQILLYNMTTVNITNSISNRWMNKWMSMEHWWNDTYMRKTLIRGEKSILVPLCPRQIPYDLHCSEITAANGLSNVMAHHSLKICNKIIKFITEFVIILPPVTFLKDGCTDFWFPSMKYGKHISM